MLAFSLVLLSLFLFGCVSVWPYCVCLACGIIVNVFTSTLSVFLCHILSCRIGTLKTFIIIMLLFMDNCQFKKKKKIYLVCVAVFSRLLLPAQFFSFNICHCLMIWRLGTTCHEKSIYLVSLCLLLVKSGIKPSHFPPTVFEVPLLCCCLILCCALQCASVAVHGGAEQHAVLQALQQAGPQHQQGVLDRGGRCCE